MSDDFGDRMKDYERAETERRFIPLLPVYARIDGRCFSRFTSGMDSPYDVRMSRAMVETTKHLVEQTHARIGYTQSDEISLVWLQERYDSEMFFAGKTQKICSVLAGMTSAFFALHCERDEYLATFTRRNSPHFDCRAFSLPNRTEAANAFLWRERDATKNSISQAARSFYSHKVLHGKSGPEMQEMIFAKGQNFNDYPALFKSGTFVRRRVVERALTAQEAERIPIAHRPHDGEMVTRSEIIKMDMPSFGTVTNREAVIFDGAEPLTAP